MIYSIIVMSIIITIYYYNKLIVHENDKKTFIVIISIITIGILYGAFENRLKNYSLIKIFKIISETIMPRFVKFMES